MSQNVRQITPWRETLGSSGLRRMVWGSEGRLPNSQPVHA